MTETIIAIIAGAIVITGCIIRYKTINNYSFIVSTKVSVFIFLSLAVGLYLVNPDKTYTIIDNIYGNGFARIFMFLSPALIPITYNILLNFTFSTSIRWSASMAWITVIVFFVVSIMGNDFKEVELIYFLTCAIALGLLHSVLGTALAGFNIAIILVSFLNQKLLNVNIASVFDLLSFLGVSSDPARWTILVCSTVLGAHSSISFDWLKEKIS